MRRIHLWQISLSASAVIIRRRRMQNRKFSPKQFVKIRRMRTLKLEQKTGSRLRLWDFKKKLKETMALLNMDESYAERDLNVGFSGGEKKKAEILQMLMLEPKLAILDETDSGLDVDAVRTVSEGVRLFRERTHGSLLIITHSTRILEALHVDVAHVMEDGVIVRNGGAELVDEINEKGFGSLKEG